MTKVATTTAMSEDIAISALSLPKESTSGVQLPTSPQISTIVVNPSQQVNESKTARAVISILDALYAHPRNHAATSSPLSTEHSKHLSPHHKLNPRSETAVHFIKSPQVSSTLSARPRTLSHGSSGLVVHDQLQKTHTCGNEGPQPSTSSLERISLERISLERSSLERSEVAGRVVGRGGSGSRLRSVVSKQEIKPVVLSREAQTTDSLLLPLRVNGRGGLASRPKYLSPAPASKSLDLRSGFPPVTQAPQPQGSSTPLVRPSGRGGAGSRSANSVQKVQNPLAPRDIMNRAKQKPSIMVSPQHRVISTLAHPISSEAAYEIANATQDSLSSLHFAGESTSLPPIFFPEAIEGTMDAAGEPYFTPPFSASASTSDGSESCRSMREEDLDIDVYLEEPPTPTAEMQRHRNLSKLMRTLGVNPYDSTTTSLSPTPDPAAVPNQPNISATQQRSLDKTSNVLRRASLSMSSIFSRPSRRQRSAGLDSRETITTITDDLHQLDLEDDALSESWGYRDTSRFSASEPPVSPIVFSPPSPPAPHKPALPPTDDVDEEIQVPASPLPLEPLEPIFAGKHIRSRSHGRSIPSSLNDVAFADFRSDSNPVAADWMFPPSQSEHDFKLSVTRNLSDKPVPWTGEWNTDIDDVISALRQLR